MKHTFSFLFILFFLISGCSQNVSLYQVRSSVVSNGKNSAYVYVWPENLDGNIVSGAVVSVTDSSHKVYNCEFNSGKQVYFSEVDSDSETCVITVKSALLSDIFRKVIPYKKVSTKPEPVTFSDASGNSVLKGGILNRDEQIQIAWNALGDCFSYTAKVSSAVNEYWRCSTDACSVFIPENELSSGLYNLEITAQWTSGDPFYESEDYFCESTIESSIFPFTVKENRE